MGFWQIVYLILTLSGLFAGACMHGKPRPNYNFRDILLAACLEMVILWKGGFFG